jgi:hypothetical protein
VSCAAAMSAPPSPGNSRSVCIACLESPVARSTGPQMRSPAGTRSPARRAHRGSRWLGGSRSQREAVHAPESARGRSVACCRMPAAAMQLRQSPAGTCERGWGTVGSSNALFDSPATELG